MNKNKIIMIGTFLIAAILTAYAMIYRQSLFPQEIGIIVANDGIQARARPEAHEKATEIKINKTQTNEPHINEIQTEELLTDEIESEETQTEKTTMAAGIQEEPQMFYYEEISQEIKDRITGKSYADNCEVPYEELRYVRVLYWGFDGKSHTGELIVNKAIAGDIVEIFEKLYEVQYPIERMELIDEYDADDNASMAADNTSAFNYRTIDDGSGRLSNHSYGMAIDINPLYNPYVRKIDGKSVISPESGADYEDRSLDCRYYIKEGDTCYQAFIERGFTWGGDWKTQKDYQHFQKELD